MIKNKTLTLGFCFISIASLDLYAQQGIVASGGDGGGSGGTLSYSIGQIDYLGYTGSGGKVSLGLQQPFEIFEIITETKENELSLSLSTYPNPVQETLNLVIKEGDFNGTKFSLYDVAGKLVKEGQITSRENLIPMQELPTATYFLKISNSTKIFKTFKIIKKA